MNQDMPGNGGQNARGVRQRTSRHRRSGQRRFAPLHQRSRRGRPISKRASSKSWFASATTPARANCRWTSSPGIPRRCATARRRRSRSRHRPGAPHRRQRRRRHHPGDLEGPKQLRVAATATNYMVGGMIIYMEGQTARRLLKADGVDMYAVNTRPECARASDEKLKASCDEQGLLLQSFAELHDRIDKHDPGRHRRPVGSAGFGSGRRRVCGRKHADDERARTDPRIGAAPRRGHDPLAGPQVDPRAGADHRRDRSFDRRRRRNDRRLCDESLLRASCWAMHRSSRCTPRSCWPASSSVSS